MSNLKYFLKGNKKKRENVKYKASKYLTDEKGEILEWTIRPISTKESDVIRDECMTEVPVKGKRGQYRQKVNISEYIAKLLCASVVEPDLNSKELQDSYGVMSAEELITEILDDPGEYSDFATFVQELNGFTDEFDEEVEKAKN